MKECKPGSEQSFRKILPGPSGTHRSAIPHLIHRKPVPLELQSLRAEWFPNLSEPGLLFPLTSYNVILQNVIFAKNDFAQDRTGDVLRVKQMP